MSEAAVTEIGGPALSRDPISITLEDLTEEWREAKFSRWGGSIDGITVDLDLEPDDQGVKPLGTINLGDHEVPVTERGLEAVARQVGVPVRYLLAVPQDEQQFMLTRRLERQGELFVSAEFTSEGVQSIRKSGSTVLEVTGILDQAIRAIGEDGVVRDAWFNHRDLRIDAFQPQEVDGVLVGIRISQDRKQNLAPKVQPLIYRVEGAITVEVPAWNIKVEARRKDELEVLAELLFQSERALDFSTHNRKHYTALATQKVEKDRSAHLRRVSVDAGLSDRVVTKIVDRVAAEVGDKEATMQDFVNLIAAQANFSPESNAARTIQQAAGSLVDDHTERCKTCHHRLI